MAAFAAGDYDAFGALVGRHRDGVVRFCLHLLADHAAAEDAAQEAFVALFRYRDRYVVGAAPRVLLYRMARHACLDMARRRRGAAPAHACPDSPDPAPGAAEWAEASERARAVRAALARLTPAQREVLALAHFEGFTYSEIARTLGVPPGTVASRAAAGYRALRKLLEQGVDADALR
jgi:RNA polymerase sigma-70 factor (ECF subfamily)